MRIDCVVIRMTKYVDSEWLSRRTSFQLEYEFLDTSEPICIKYQDENNNILGVDTSELRFGGVRNLSLSWKLVLELSSLNHTHVSNKDEQ